MPLKFVTVIFACSVSDQPLPMMTATVPTARVAKNIPLPYILIVCEFEVWTQIKANIPFPARGSLDYRVTD